MSREAVVVVIDFKEDRFTLGLEVTKVMFFMRVVGVTKVVVDRDGLDDSCNGLRSESGDTRRHDGDASVLGFDGDDH